MDKLRVLVIEDDPSIRWGILHSLSCNGFETLEAADAGRGLELALEAEYDLMLLDLVLPGGDGLDILRQVRIGNQRVPVIILTARGEEDDRVKGLKWGADDYVVKPFSIRELLARVNAVLRRSPARPSEILQLELPQCVVDFGKRELRFPNLEPCALSEREAELLAYLLKNEGRAVSRDELLARVWRMNPDAIATRTVDMHIAKLREKLKEDPESPKVITTIWGRGYMFNKSTP
jgi:DNA-binding response OmpR family regulator